MPSPAPIDPGAARFRLPVEPPARNLVIASLAAVAGACQLFAWALGRLPSFFLIFGTVLMAAAVAIALGCLFQHRRLSWVIYVGPDTLVVRWRHRHKVMPWASVRGVRYESFRLAISTSGARDLILPVDRTRAAHDGADAVRRSIEQRLGQRSAA